MIFGWRVQELLLCGEHHLLVTLTTVPQRLSETTLRGNMKFLRVPDTIEFHLEVPAIIPEKLPFL